MVRGGSARQPTPFLPRCHPGSFAPHPHADPELTGSERSSAGARSAHWIALASLAATAALAVVLLAGRNRPWPVTAATAVGDATCLSCHRQQGTFELTAHRLTSRLTTGASIAGSFAPGENVLQTSNPTLHYRMDSTSHGFSQTAVVGAPPNGTEHSEQIAYVIGSARKGQTYLYARGDALFELPVSYWTSLHRWINSPGYYDGSVNFGRPATPRCLECHSTWFQSAFDSTATNRYVLASATLGITCERCHGAGGAHVAREQSPLRVLGPAILDPARLPRARQIDGCAQCHGGAGRLKDAAFGYLPTRPLAQHLELDPAPIGAQVDVHGNQVALLERSRCFRASNMTCSTCHDVHRVQRDTKELSGRCLACHQARTHQPIPAQTKPLAGRCVDCHMPLQTSNLIVSQHEGVSERPKVRTHWIKIYPER